MWAGGISYGSGSSRPRSEATGVVIAAVWPEGVTFGDSDGITPFETFGPFFSCVVAARRWLSWRTQQCGTGRPIVGRMDAGATWLRGLGFAVWRPTPEGTQGMGWRHPGDG